MFYIGQKVIYVDDTIYNPTAHPKVITPIKGGIYIIREIYESQIKPGKYGLLLKEITNITNEIWNREIGFWSKRFRLLDNIKINHEFADEVLKKLQDEYEKELVKSFCMQE